MTKVSSIAVELKSLCGTFSSIAIELKIDGQRALIRLSAFCILFISDCLGTAFLDCGECNKRFLWTILPDWEIIANQKIDFGQNASHSFLLIYYKLKEN